MLRLGLDRTQEVRLICAILLSVQVLLVAWVMSRAWFYADDFTFLDDALSGSLSPRFLMAPHDSQLMPLGRLLTWFVAHSGPFSWWAVVLSTLVIQAAAGVACILMLRTLFGYRWGIIAPLSLYLFSPMGIEASLWWSAALNAIPMQLAFFLLVTGVVRWFRRHHLSDAMLAVGALFLAAISGPRGLVMIVPVAVLTLVFLVPGPWWKRPWTAVKDHLRLMIPLAVVAVGYLVTYVATTPPPVEESGSAPALAIAKNLIGTSWLTSAVGGPWSWSQPNPPLSFPDPPVVLHVAAAVLMVLVLTAAAARHRKRAAGAVAVLVAQLGVTLVALLVGRGIQLGADAGLISRYLADTLPVTALALGLAFLPLVSAGASENEDDPQKSRADVIMSRPHLRFAAPVLVTLVTLGGVGSTLNYASTWHANDPARSFVSTARLSLAADPVVLADVDVPASVRSPLASPENRPSRLLRPLGSAVRTATRGNDLSILDDTGRATQAEVIQSDRADNGPDPDCGYRVDARPATISLDPRKVVPFWWTSLGYLSSTDGQLEIAIDGRPLPSIDVQKGLHTYFLSGEGPFSEITLRAIDPGLTVCVNPVVTGTLGALP